METIKQRGSLFDRLSTLAIFATCAFVVYANWSSFRPPVREIPLPTQPVSIDGASRKGSDSAPVVLIEWSDYECPFCGKAERETLPSIDKRFLTTGKVELAFYQHPLTRIHSHAQKAAEAAVCSGRQGKFWEMQTALFNDQKHLTEPDLELRAKAIGLDATQFSKCMAGEAVAQVQADAKRAEELGLTSTPSFLVGRRQPDGRVQITGAVAGVRSESEFVENLNKALGDSGPSYLLIASIVGGAAVLLSGLGFAIRRKRLGMNQVSVA